MLKNGKQKKTWKIPVTWEVCSTIMVEAPTLKEAMIIARDDEGDIPLPSYTETDYVDGSWKTAHDMSELEEVRSLYNDNQPDCSGINNQR